MRQFLRLVCVWAAFTSGFVSASEIPLTQVIFEEVEPGLEPYTTRLLVNKRYLRLDEGFDDGDYVLFDRVKGEIHNFNHEERTEIIIQRRVPTKLDSSIPFVIQKKPLKSAPSIDNITAVEHRFIADNELCKTSINFNGLMPKVVTALIQYQEILLQQNRQTLDEIPDSVKTPCYLANHYLYSSAHLEAGFPVYMADNEGKQRKLLDFGQVMKPASLLDRAKNYRVYYPTLPTQG